MKTPAIKFNSTIESASEDKAFYTELKKRVNQYFKDNNKTRYGNFNMKLKTVFMISLNFIPLTLMLTGVVSSTWLVFSMWTLMGFGTAGIGLSIMHDANHGSYSKNDTVNKLLGYMFDLIGSYHINWKIQHNVLHHTFTNVGGYDEDIDTRVMRLSPNQERKSVHKFQAYYATFFYGIMTIYWLISKDFEQVVKYSKNNLLKAQGLTFGTALTQVIIIKICYFTAMIALPIIITSIPWYQVVLGFLLMHVITGLILSFIFQTAHILEETEFFEVDETGSIENNWAIHQLKTTSNFAHNSKFFSWFIGGLNYQVEHHLFPNICHVHYKALSPIVQKTAEEFNIPYHQHKTFFGAIRSHFSLLNRLGTGAYDSRISA